MATDNSGGSSRLIGLVILGAGAVISALGIWMFFAPGPGLVVLVLGLLVLLVGALAYGSGRRPPDTDRRP